MASMQAAMVAAVIIFVVMFVLIVTEKFERHYITLIAGGITLIVVFGILLQSGQGALEVINIKQIGTLEFWYGHGSEESSGINWATIIFLLGMMIMVEGMGHSGFFRWLCATLIRLVNYKITPIFISFMALSALLAMFIDSITVILFLAAITVEVSRVFKFDPVSLIIPEIFFANLGGSATMSGDPPNIIIGTSLGYSFTDFLLNTGFIALISFIVLLLFFYFTSRKTIREAESAFKDAGPVIHKDPNEEIKSRFSFITNIIIFIFAIVLLVTHAATGLSVATIGVVVAILSLVFNIHVIKPLLKGVDYKTLLFFLGLFVVVGGLEKTGVLGFIAHFISSACGGNALIMVLVIMYISAVASAIVDNIPFAATMIPVITLLAAESGIELPILAWALAIGTDIGGAATPIGASANVVGVSISAKEGHPISWGRYCKESIPATLITLAIATVIIVLRYFTL